MEIAAVAYGGGVGGRLEAAEVVAGGGGGLPCAYHARPFCDVGYFWHAFKSCLVCRPCVEAAGFIVAAMVASPMAKRAAAIAPHRHEQTHCALTIT